MSARLMNKSWKASVPAMMALLASVLLFGCMGGTGTDTENGVQVTARVVDSTGAPQSHVDVQVRTLTSRPDTVTASPVEDDTIALRTDENGFVRFRVHKPGLYMAQGQRGDSVLLLDTLVAQNSDTTVFHTGAVRRLKGRVRLYSGYQVDTGYAFVRGSGIAARIDRDGAYDFGYMPSSATTIPLGVEYSAQPIGHVFVKLADAAGSLVVDSRFSVDASLIPTGTSPSLTLFKAAGSDTDLCLEDAQESVVPGISLKGSLGKAMDIQVGAAYACSQKVGSLIQVNQADPAGNKVKSLGDYVLPDIVILPAIIHSGFGSTPKGLKVVVPVTCLKTGASVNFVTNIVQSSDGADIRVDDIGLDSSCGY